jgi:hypothetical protein
MEALRALRHTKETATQPKLPRNATDFKYATSFQISVFKLRKLKFD